MGTLIDNPDIGSWRQRLAGLLAGYDLADPRERQAAHEVVAEAAAQTSMRGLRDLTFRLGYRGYSPRSRGEAVAKIVARWADLPAEQRRAPDATDADVVDTLRQVADLAAEAAADFEVTAEQVTRLARLVRYLVDVTPGAQR